MLLVFYILISLLFRVTGHSFISDIVLWVYYAIFILLLVIFLIRIGSQRIDMPGKLIIIFIPFSVAFGFLDSSLLKALMSICLLIIFLIATDRVMWFNKKNWQYSFLIIFLYIISVVFAFVSLKYAGKKDYRVMSELVSPTEQDNLIIIREIEGASVGETLVYLEKNYFNFIKHRELKYSTSWTGLPVLEWINEKEYKINHKEFKIK
ncbi:MAG: hypothetical protein GY834_08935 [Bacteroidetes bacterium]|nr:hypothetical protein [Bacteroidota bacterium]